MIILLVLLAVIIDQGAAHAEIRNYRRMLLLVNTIQSAVAHLDCNYKRLTEYSHKT